MRWRKNAPRWALAKSRQAGKALRSERVMQGMSQVEFAADIGVAQSVVAKWENYGVPVNVILAVNAMDEAGILRDVLRD
jgi:predicted transcriptional regulator